MCVQLQAQRYDECGGERGGEHSGGEGGGEYGGGEYGDCKGPASGVLPLLLSGVDAPEVHDATSPKNQAPAAEALGIVRGFAFGLLLLADSTQRVRLPAYRIKHMTQPKIPTWRKLPLRTSSGSMAEPSSGSKFFALIVSRRWQSLKPLAPSLSLNTTQQAAIHRNRARRSCCDSRASTRIFLRSFPSIKLRVPAKG